MCKTYIMKGSDVIGSGHAYATSISKEKGLEKLESVSIGRAMASLGLSGGEYASDSEMESWKGRYEPQEKFRKVFKFTKEDMDAYEEEFRDCDTLEKLEDLKGRGRAEWDEKGPKHREKIAKLIREKENELTSGELDQQFEQKMEAVK
jgi:hypothetical protein